MVHYPKTSVPEYDNFRTIFQFFFHVRPGPTPTSIVISHFFYFAKPLTCRTKTLRNSLIFFSSIKCCLCCFTCSFRRFFTSISTDFFSFSIARSSSWWLVRASLNSCDEKVQRLFSVMIIIIIKIITIKK